MRKDRNKCTRTNLVKAAIGLGFNKDYVEKSVSKSFNVLNIDANEISCALYNGLLLKFEMDSGVTMAAE